MHNVTYENEQSNYIIEGYLFRDDWNDSYNVDQVVILQVSGKDVFN